MILHAGPRYQVRYNRVSETPQTVVCFDPWSQTPGFGTQFFAEEFLRKRGINAIGITPAQNDWYLDAEVEYVLQAVRGATAGQEVTCYGASMGGYAAVNFAPDLLCSRVVAITPQASPDQQRTPFEQRWFEERRLLDCSRDRLGRGGPRVSGYTIFDPYTADDVKHVLLLLAVHDLLAVPVAFSGHHPLAVLKECGLVEAVLLSMLDGSFDPIEFRHKLRVQRRKSATFWLNFAQKVADRNRDTGALNALRAARRNVPKESFQLDDRYAALLVLAGQLTEARAILARWATDAVYGVEAREGLERIEAQEHGTAVAPTHESAVPVVLIAGFLAGTRIETPAGPVPIEALADGEIVPSCDGRMLQVRRVRRQRCDPTSWRRRGNLPILIPRHSIADGLPTNDIYVAPDQMLEVQGTLVTARTLMDGAEIGRSETPEPVTYYSVEFESPAAILVAGIPAWSGDKGQINAQATAVRALRERLAARRHLAGFSLVADPDLRVIARGTTLLPIDQADNVFVYELPTNVTNFDLVSRHFVPDEIWPDSSDWRRLGVGLQAVQIEHDGQTSDVDLDDPRHQGLHLWQQDAGRSWRWTDGRAMLQCKPLSKPGRLVIRLAMAGTYWVRHPERPPEATTGQRVIFISGEPDTPGHIYRVERHAGAIRWLGHHVSWIRVAEIPQRIGDIHTCDVLVIWRAPYDGTIGSAIDAARKAGAYVIFDVDDLVVEPSLAAPDVIDAIRFNGLDPAAIAELYRRFRQTADRADMCTCSTAELGHYLQAMGRPALVVPNGFDDKTLRASRNQMRQRLLRETDGLIRIGYAAGTHTHQRDMRLAAKALARVLTEFPECRLVLFQDRASGRPVVDLQEFPALRVFADRVEWRPLVPLAELSHELARLDINIVPVEVSNPYCEAKSELKFFEAALAGVCTVASPTGPFRRAIRDGETGFLAGNEKEWYSALRQLVRDGSLRRRVATAAYHDVLWHFGPERKIELLANVIGQLGPGRASARAFLGYLQDSSTPRELPHVPSHEVVHRSDGFGDADATVIVPVFNYRQYLPEALDSVARQTEPVLDLVVIDDQSRDDSLAVALAWVAQNGARFNRVLVLQNLVNSGLGLTRNVGFAAAETPWVLPLDADNRLRPNCIVTCLRVAKTSGAAFCYPAIQQFGGTTELMNTEDYHAVRLAAGNFIDAMALIAKSAWAAIGGYQHVQHGWEDYDFWCRIAEFGLWGERVDQVLADYRVHDSSMLRTRTDVERNKRRLVADLQARHEWLQVKRVLEIRAEKPQSDRSDERRPNGKGVPKRRVITSK